MKTSTPQHLQSLPGKLSPGKSKAVNIVKRHIRKMTLHVALYYPKHERRTTSSEFRHTRDLLINEQKRACYTCGTRKKLEVHHFWVEWSLANAIDFELLKKVCPAAAKYPTIDKFVDSPDNMRVLCAKHHRHKNYGIHMMDYPDWVAQTFIKEGYQFHTQEETQ